jgi:TPR repeat protein
LNGQSGLAKNEWEAARLLKLAADQGYVLAQANLGWIFERLGWPHQGRAGGRTSLQTRRRSRVLMAGMLRDNLAPKRTMP